jgi:hypothetical protein
MNRNTCGLKYYDLLQKCTLHDVGCFMTLVERSLTKHLIAARFINSMRTDRTSVDIKSEEQIKDK